MKFIEGAIAQPVTVLVGVIAVLLSGLIALRKIPIQLTPNVEDTIVTVSTYWEGASPEEIEQEIIDEQEEKLQGIANLRETLNPGADWAGWMKRPMVWADRRSDYPEVYMAKLHVDHASFRAWLTG